MMGRPMVVFNKVNFIYFYMTKTVIDHSRERQNPGAKRLMQLSRK